MVKLKRYEPFGSLVHFTSDCTTFRLNREETREYLNYEGEFPNDLSGPEIVHLELTRRCNKDCDYCYVDQDGEGELTTDEWKEVIDKLVKNKVFQFTFGGGEPFIRPDILELAEYVREDKNRNLAVTSNGTLLEDDDRLKYFDKISFSYHGSIEDIKEPIEIADRYTKVGINFVLRRDTLMDIPKVAKLCKEKDLELLIMTYKPVNNDWEQKIPTNTVYKIAQKLADQRINTSVDMMTCNRCTGAEAFFDVSSDGSVYPCSFIRSSVGSILNNDFRYIWNRMEKPSCPYLRNIEGKAYE